MKEFFIVYAAELKKTLYKFMFYEYHTNALYKVYKIKVIVIVIVI